MAFGGTKNTRLNDPELRKLRALMILQARVQGSSLGALAKKFTVSEHTIKNEIDYAKREGLLSQFEDQILDDLVPLAVGAYRKALANGDTAIATEVLKGMGILAKRPEKSLTRPEPEAAAPDSLEGYIIKQLGRSPSAGAHHRPARLTAASADGLDGRDPDEDRPLGAEIIEAQVVPGGSESRETRAETHVGLPTVASRPGTEPTSAS